METKIKVIVEIPKIDNLKALIQKHRELINALEENARDMYGCAQEINLKLDESVKRN